VSAEKERLVLLNRAGHAPKLKEAVTGSTTNGYVLTFDSSTVSWYAAAGGGTAPAEAKYVTLGLDASLTNERVLTAGGETGITITDNGAGETVQLSLTNNSITITAGSGMSGGGATALGGTATLNVVVDDSTLSINLGGGLEVKAGGITPAKLAFEPRKDAFTGDGLGAAFNLSTRILAANWRDGVVVARNGQLLKQVGDSPSDVSEYTILDNGEATTLTLGANLGSGEQLLALYWA
jgi:hypothetical protein